MWVNWISCAVDRLEHGVTDEELRLPTWGTAVCTGRRAGTW